MADLHHPRALELARRNDQHYTFRYRSILLHWFGRLFRRAAPVDIAPLPPVEPGQVAVTWGGHATALIRYHRVSVLCDPVLSRSLGGVRRELAPGLTLDLLADVDLVLVSYAGADHLDVDTLARLSRGATVVVPPGAAARVSPLRFARLVELAVGSSLVHRDLEVTAEAVQHGERDSPAQSYILRGDGPAVYFCGASGYFPGFGEIGQRHWPDVALLPIGGYRPRSFRRRYMSPLDALYAFEDLRARVMVPIRYGTFALSYERLNEPERWLAELVSERHLERFVVRLGAGESRVFVPPAAAAVEGGRYEAAGPPRSGSEGDFVGDVTTVAPRPREIAPRPAPLPPAPRRQPSLLEPEAVTIPGVAPVVSPIEPVAERPVQRRPAVVVDQEDETGVFDRPSEPRVPPARDATEDDEEEEGTHAIVPALSEREIDAEREPAAAVTLPGSR